MRLKILTLLVGLAIWSTVQADSKSLAWYRLWGDQFNTVAIGTVYNVKHHADTMLFHRNEKGYEFWAIHDWGDIEIHKVLEGTVDSTHIQVTWFVKSHHVLPPGLSTPIKLGDTALENGAEGIWILNMGGSKLNGRRRFLYLPMDSLAAVVKYLELRE